MQIGDVGLEIMILCNKLLVEVIYATYKGTAVRIVIASSLPLTGTLRAESLTPLVQFGLCPS